MPAYSQPSSPRIWNLSAKSCPADVGSIGSSEYSQDATSPDFTTKQERRLRGVAATSFMVLSGSGNTAVSPAEAATTHSIYATPADTEVVRRFDRLGSIPRAPNPNDPGPRTLFGNDSQISG